MILGAIVGETQVFEFKGNALIHFRVRLRSDSLSVSTMKKAGGEAVKTWDVDFSRIESVRVAERRGARTSLSGLYLKPRGSDVVMFAWQKSALGAPVGEGRTYYSAAIATLRTIAAQRPDLSATIGPGRASLVGATLGAIVFVAAAFFAVGQINATFAITAGAIIALYGLSALRSGALQTTREVSLTHAADELAARTAH